MFVRTRFPYFMQFLQEKSTHPLLNKKKIITLHQYSAQPLARCRVSRNCWAGTKYNWIFDKKIFHNLCKGKGVRENALPLFFEVLARKKHTPFAEQKENHTFAPAFRSAAGAMQSSA